MRKYMPGKDQSKEYYLAIKKARSTDKCYNMDKPQKYFIQWKKPYILYDPSYAKTIYHVKWCAMWSVWQKGK